MKKRTKKVAKKTIKRIVRVRTAKQMLRLLDSFFAKNTLESKMLWDVLSATRGPDNQQGKDEMTVPIRDAAFPKTRDVFNGPGHFQVPAAFGGGQFKDLYGGQCLQHFTAHARKAARVLGLIQ